MAEEFVAKFILENNEEIEARFSVTPKDDHESLYNRDKADQHPISAITNLAETLADKQDVISDLDEIRAGAEAGATAVQPEDLATVATTGDYDDLANKPTIPTVNNATLTIQKNGTTVNTFTANASSDVTANITVPTTASDVGALPDTTTINDLTTAEQQAALNSGATSTNIGQITTNANDISDIKDLIPSQASDSNQLADKNFVNSSIATNTANFIGTFNSVAELEAYSGTLTNNDYAFVVGTDSEGNTVYDRYKYTTSTTPASWQFEYELNNSSFTAAQWDAINSGITTGDVSLIATALQPNDNISELVNDAGYTTNIGTVTSVNNTSPDGNGNVSITIPTTTDTVTSGSAAALTSGGAYTALSNKQDSLPSQSGQSGKYLTTDGSNLSWGTPSGGGGSVDIDNSTITTNSSDEIQTVGIKDVRTNNTLKIWTGTKAQYDAISPKDSNTLYNVTDDITIQTAVLSAMFPVGAIYTAKTNTCPLEDMGIGTWQELSPSRILIAKKEATAEDKTWYNLYSDGYCEQGGMEPNDATTISLSISFRDTLYNVFAMQNGTDGAYLNRAETISTKTVSSFYIDFKTMMAGATGTFTYYDWIAVGYASTTGYTIPKQWERIS